MNYNEFENQLKGLVDNYYEDKWLTLKQIKELFENFLQDNPNNSEVLIRYAIFLLEDLHEDYEAIEPLKIVLDKDPNNIEAALIMAYIIFGFMTALYEDYILERLSALKTNNPELLSMIQYVKALYYSQIYDPSYPEHLKKSVELHDRHVHNCFKLGGYYGEKTEDGKKLIKKALDNVQLIYIYLPDVARFKINTKEDFLNEYIKGTHITDSNYKFKKESLDS